MWFSFQAVFTALDSPNGMPRKSKSKLSFSVCLCSHLNAIGDTNSLMVACYDLRSMQQFKEKTVLRSEGLNQACSEVNAVIGLHFPIAWHSSSSNHAWPEELVEWDHIEYSCLNFLISCPPRSVLVSFFDTSP